MAIFMVLPLPLLSAQVSPRAGQSQPPGRWQPSGGRSGRGGRIFRLQVVPEFPIPRDMKPARA